jgi:hypothetical protein
MWTQSILLSARCAVLLSIVAAPRLIEAQANLPPELAGPAKVAKHPNPVDDDLSKVLDQLHDEKATKENYELLDRFVSKHPDYPLG